MSHKIFLLLCVTLLGGCQHTGVPADTSPHHIKPVESGTVLIKKWSAEDQQSVLNTGPKDNLNSVHLKEQHKWDEWNQAFQKDYTLSPNAQFEHPKVDRLNK